MLEWAAISFSRDLPDPGTEPGSPALGADALPSEPPGKPEVAIPFSRASSRPRDGTHISRWAANSTLHWQADSLPREPPGEPSDR